MYRITSIEPQKKDPERVSIFINEKFDFGITVKMLERYGLHIGQVLTQESYETLMEKMLLDKAKYRALDYLASHHKTEWQVREKLTKLEYGTHVIDAVIDFLIQYKYIDDMAYATRYTEQKARIGRKSGRQIQSLLYSKGIKGINPFEISEDMYEIEEKNVLYYLEKYNYSKALEFKQRQKLISRLMTKGFKYEIIQNILAKLDESFEV
ncbi:MAG: hypothetical protein ACRCSG_08395 [Cellulosilyticaceae bacterium]